jgi:4-aminobutyrate aminotransferase
MAAVPRGVGHATAIYAKRAKNAEIWSEDGKRYIDFASGIAVVNTGHLHPKVIAAVEDQLKSLSHACFQVTPYETYVRLAERLNAIAPVAGPAKTILLSTGAEAVENAVKVARAFTGRAGIVSFAGGFHGRTLMGMALTGKVVPYKKGFGPFPPEVYNVAFPNTYHGVSGEQSLAALNALFKYTADPSSIATIIVEPVQGEGGFYIAPFDFLRSLRALCDQHGILLIADEIQTGFARTGKMFGLEHAGIKADVVTMAKSLAGGFPLSAVTGRAELMDAPGPGGLGGTYAGNPLGVAAAHAVLDVIEEEKLCDRANSLGGRLKQRLESLRDDVPEIVDIRGPGFMNAIEFNDVKKGLPSAEFANAVRLKALEKGLILLTCGVYGNVIRFLAPITIQDNVMNEALDILESSIREARA